MTTQKTIYVEPILRMLRDREDNPEDLPPLTVGDFIRMLEEAEDVSGKKVICSPVWMGIDYAEGADFSVSSDDIDRLRIAMLEGAEDVSAISLFHDWDEEKRKVHFVDDDHVWIDGKQYISLRRFQEAVTTAKDINVSDTNVGDTISRQAAIDALDKRFDSIPMEQTTEILMLRRDLRELPPAESNCDYEHAGDMRDYCEHWETTYNPDDGSM